jgi:hypothetical protein
MARVSPWRNATLRCMERKPRPQDSDREERVAIPLDPEAALRALLQVDPGSEPANDEPLKKPNGH